MFRDLDARIGARVKYLRMRRAISPEAAAEALAMTPAEYRARERGHGAFSASEILILCGLMEIRADEIYEPLLEDPDPRVAKH